LEVIQRGQKIEDTVPDSLAKLIDIPLLICTLFSVKSYFDSEKQRLEVRGVEIGEDEEQKDEE